MDISKIDLGKNGIVSFKDAIARQLINSLESSKASNESVQTLIDNILSSIPNKTSQLINDGNGTSNFATLQYVINSIGAIPTPDVSGQITVHNQNNEAHQDIRLLLNTKQSIINDLNTIRNGANAGATAVQPSDIGALASLNNIDYGSNYITNKPNLSNFITNTVNSLTNYYLKAETYTKSEVNSLISSIKTIKVEVVAELPNATSNTYFNNNKTIYLVAYTGSVNDYYNEYITIRSGVEGSYTYSWEKIGNTQIDISNYVQKTFTIAGIDLQDNITKSELLTALNVEDGAEVNAIESISVDNVTVVPDANKNVNIDLSGKLDKVTTTAGDRRLYAINANGTQTTVILDYPNTASAGRVPCRSSSGALMINDRTYDNPGQFDDGLQAVNKNKLIEMTTAKTGSSAPTTSTVGFVGQQYVNTTNNKVYECIAITTNDDVTTYTWKELTNNIESISAGGQALTPDANGNVNIPVGKNGGYNSTNKGVISVCSFSGLSLSSIDINGGHLWCASTDAKSISTRGKYGGVVPRILTNDKINDIVKAALTDSKHLTMTAAEQAVAKSVLGVATIKTTMDNVAEVNTEYYLGSQSTVDITMPSTATAGDKITVDFTSGSTATTLTLTGTIAGDTSFIPEANKLIEMNFKYDGTYWKMLISSLDVPSGV